MTQITAMAQLLAQPDPLERHYVRFGADVPYWRSLVATIIKTGLGALAGWVSSQAWAGRMPPVLGTTTFVYLALIALPLFAHSMQMSIIKPMLCLAATRYALIEAMLARPAEPLGDQGL